MDSRSGIRRWTPNGQLRNKNYVNASSSDTSTLEEGRASETADLALPNKATARPGNGKRRSLQVLSLMLFLITWVANGELLQGISSGSFGDQEAYDKPAFITWFSYNFMTLSLLIVYPYVKYYRKNWTLDHYVRHVWPGKLGLYKAGVACLAISLTLQLLNILLILSLECISVPLSNAVYQMQTLFTVGLSVGLLRDDFVLSEAIGVVISTLGVAFIVIPPLYYPVGDPTASEKDSTCSWPSIPVGSGILSSLGSSAIGSAYLVSWRVFDEQRNVATLSRLEGLVDTQMTLAMIGLSNLILGWPVLLLAHWGELEIFQWPQMVHWKVLLINGLVEYLFDASCAVAIYMTSPVIVAVSSPLTIPLGIIADWLFAAKGLSTSVGSVQNNSLNLWFGAFVIWTGIYLLETKPNLLERSGKIRK